MTTASLPQRTNRDQPWLRAPGWQIGVLHLPVRIPNRRCDGARLFLVRRSHKAQLSPPPQNGVRCPSILEAGKKEKRRRRISCVSNMNSDSPAGSDFYHRGLHPLRGNEKGDWCKSPFSRTDPPKPESQSRLGSGHPGKPILFVDWDRANGVPVTTLGSGVN
jgi:hypothetical protein